MLSTVTVASALDTSPIIAYISFAITVLSFIITVIKFYKGEKK